MDAIAEAGTWVALAAVGFTIGTYAGAIGAGPGIQQSSVPG